MIQIYDKYLNEKLPKESLEAAVDTAFAKNINVDKETQISEILHQISPNNLNDEEFLEALNIIRTIILK